MITGHTSGFTSQLLSTATPRHSWPIFPVYHPRGVSYPRKLTERCDIGVTVWPVPRNYLTYWMCNADRPAAPLRDCFSPNDVESGLKRIRIDTEVDLLDVSRAFLYIEQRDLTCPVSAKGIAVNETRTVVGGLLSQGHFVP